MRAILLAVWVLAGMASLNAQEMVTDSGSGRSFPKQITFKAKDIEYVLELTGTTTRIQYFMNIYAIAHYLQDPVKGPKDTVYEEIFQDRQAKELFLVWTIDVDQEDVKEGLWESFLHSSTANEIDAVRDQIGQFLGYFESDIKTNDQVIVRWLPEGVVLTEINGKRMQPIRSLPFARALWNIWLGPKSVVNRSYLIRFIKTD
jgi:hypothetical protein